MVKDKEVARKMVKFMEVSSIGVSKESQLRAAKILGTICDDYQNFGPKETENFFEYAKRIMIKRWEKLRETIKKSEIFSLPKYPQEYCIFSSEYAETYPGKSS